MGLVLAASIWAARRELRSRQQSLTWPLLMALLLVFPSLYLLFSALVINIRGSVASYWCILTLPVILLLTLAWHAPLPAWLRWSYRTLVVGVIGLQLVVTLLDRGDLQREATQWIIRNHGPQDKVLVARGEAYLDVFSYLGFTDWPRLEMLKTYHRRPRGILYDLQQKLQNDHRLLLILYRPRADIKHTLQLVEKSGDVAAWRVWELNKVTTVAALAHGVNDIQWLRNLPELRRPWGPSRGDF